MKNLNVSAELYEMAKAAVVKAAADSLQGYGWFNRNEAETVGYDILDRNPWMGTEDIRDYMIYKLTGEAP